MTQPTVPPVPVEDIIGRYQQLLADATHRAVIAEAQLAAVLAQQAASAEPA